MRCPDDHPHSIHCFKAHGCKCSKCGSLDKLAHRERRRMLVELDLHSRVSAKGARRRIQALACLGWSTAALAKELPGTSYRHIMKIREGDLLEINRTTHDKFVYLYNLLDGTRLRGRYPDMVRKMALEKGWAPPLAWDDIDKDQKPKFGRQRTPLYNGGKTNEEE